LSLNHPLYAGQTFAGAIAYLPVGESQVRYAPSVFMAATNAALQRPWLPINADSALYKFAARNHLGYPQTPEFEFSVGASAYVGQLYEAGLLYVIKGDWNNIKQAQKVG